MRKLFVISTLFILSVLIITSCINFTSMYKKGKYDLAVYQAVKKIRKNPKEKYIAVLKKSYPIANQEDLDRIKFLKMEGKPDIWDEVFERYQKLKDRQDLVKTVTPIKYSGGTLDFKIVDYDADIIAAKKKAAEYFYVHSKKLIESNNRFAARQSYNELLRINDYYPNYKDVNTLLKKALAKGTTFVYLDDENNTHFKLNIIISKRFISI